MGTPSAGLAAVAVASLILAAPARADELSFLNNLHNIEVTSGAGDLSLGAWGLANLRSTC